ncbi:hypothetical protein Dsin_027912 [Dipteronia sinensis]|uniref:F-box domain-containing protein n=1 Tax=Dipteronia sinensis TaxID=43782 RepID=A0AAE0DU14_9ROSI|nr:hypothetical protein Dsin_027912 [Dipteronia sinensis]
MDCKRLRKRYNKGKDIISRLPDDVLSHIVSRLEAEDAVKTCVLSSRWKNVWTLIYNLCINLPEEDDEGDEGNRGTLFVDFVELVSVIPNPKVFKNFISSHLMNFKKVM